MRAIPPLTLRDGYFARVEAEINRLFYDIMYRPLLEILEVSQQGLEREIKNSKDPLLDAIKQGDVWYENGQFRGRFNARISAAILRLGGLYNVPSRTYSLSKSKLPVEYRFAQAQAQSRYEELRAGMLSAIDNMDPEIVDKISKTKEEYERTVTHLEGDLQKTLPKQAPASGDNPATARSRIIIEAQLTEGQKRVIAENWGQNLDLYIKGWAQENILKLRQEIQPHVLAGGRAEGLIKVLQDNYGVSKRKAKFLARQETALLMSQFQETRYQDIGIDKYRWSDSHDVRVRHDHHELNGKVFEWKTPPISNKKTSARNHPGQDYGCRCIAIPLI